MQAQPHLIDTYTRHKLNLDLSIYVEHAACQIWCKDSYCKHWRIFYMHAYRGGHWVVQSMAKRNMRDIMFAQITAKAEQSCAGYG